MHKKKKIFLMLRQSMCNFNSINGVGSKYTISFSFFKKKVDRKSTRLNSSHSQISYAVFCLKKKKQYAPRRRLLHPLRFLASLRPARGQVPPVAHMRVRLSALALFGFLLQTRTAHDSDPNR